MIFSLSDQKFPSHDKITAPGTTGPNAERVNDEETKARFSPGSYPRRLSCSVVLFLETVLRQCNAGPNGNTAKRPPRRIFSSKSPCSRRSLPVTPRVFACAYAVRNRLSRRRYRLQQQQQQRTYTYYYIAECRLSRTAHHEHVRRNCVSAVAVLAYDRASTLLVIRRYALDTPTGRVRARIDRRGPVTVEVSGVRLFTPRSRPTAVTAGPAKDRRNRAASISRM